MRNEIEKMIADIRAENSNTHPANDLYSAGIVTGRYDVINKLGAILSQSDNDYKRGVVDGLEIAANHISNYLTIEIPSIICTRLRDEAKRVREEK